MTDMRIGILHPGEMGASVAAAAREAGAKVSWASAGRSDVSHRRAVESGLEDKTNLAELTSSSDMIIAVCPPEAATAMAETVAGLLGHLRGCQRNIDRTAREVAAIVENAGAQFVDGGIIGPPAHREGTTRLYLSGAEASTVASAFQGSVLEAVVIDSRPGAASALKMCYAAWTKGSAALLTAVRTLALAEGVEAALLNEWSKSQQGLEARSAASARNNAFKAWRFAGEMREIAATFEASGLPNGFHTAAADIYQRLAPYKDCDSAPELADVIDTILTAGN